MITPEQALKEALVLAITAESDEQADRAIGLAGEIISRFGLDEVTVRRVQRQIEEEG